MTGHFSLVLSLFLPLLLTASPATCWGSFSSTYHFHYYWFSLEPKTHTAAETFCSDLGGHLVWVDSQDEQRWLAGQVATIEDSAKYWFLGLLDHMGEDGQANLTWTSGKPVIYSNLAAGEPSHTTENCVTMEKPMDFRWADVRCDRSEAFICKMGINTMATKMAAFNRNKYYVSEAKMAFRDAQHFCEGIGANLVWIQNKPEADRLMDHISSKEPELWYLGMQSSVGDGAVQNTWVSGQPVTWSLSDKPTDGCFAINKTKQDTWTEIDCSRKESFICKLDRGLRKRYTYWLSRDATTAENAEQFCGGLGGHLGWITSQVENDWLGGQLFLESGPSSWILGYRGQKADASCWYGDFRCGFSNFIQPLRSTSNDVCVTMETDRSFRWDSINCSRNESFICKVPIQSQPRTYGIYQYLFFTSALNFTDARSFCLKVGANLAWVSDEEEMAWLAQVLKTSYPAHRYWYIGLYDFVGRNQPEAYHWLSGDKSGYRNFARREPNHGYEKCVTVEAPMSYKWADVTCDRTEPFVCKRPGKRVLAANIARYS